VAELYLHAVEIKDDRAVGEPLPVLGKTHERIPGQTTPAAVVTIRLWWAGQRSAPIAVALRILVSGRPGPAVGLPDSRPAA
jgi:hypothetical protein